jgi:hypothetical protein
VLAVLLAVEEDESTVSTTAAAAADVVIVVEENFLANGTNGRLELIPMVEVVLMDMDGPAACPPMRFPSGPKDDEVRRRLYNIIKSLFV